MTAQSQSDTAKRRSWILRGSDGGDLTADVVGGKAGNLARLAAAGVRVPAWIVINAHAFRDLVLQRVGTPDDETEIAAWQERVRRIDLPSEFSAELRAALAEEGLEEALLAVRSSAVSEDGASSSYAGQFDTELGVRAGAVEDAVRQVWASAANRHALAYGGELAPMSVVVQAMVDARVSGVAFAADPVTGQRSVAVVSALWGLGEGLVSGDLDADTYRVQFEHDPPRVEAATATKTHRIRLLESGGTVREELPEGIAGEQPVLAESLVLDIAAEVRRISDQLGAPQDVEWAIDDASPPRLYILQARPITTLPQEVAGERRLWDNSNIVESYAGITSPLTFSFARYVYEQVYRQFCEVVGVPADLVERHRHVFANMLGSVRGRVYYNLLNWYRTLALLPGYSVNREFMERMMGVREKLDRPPLLESTSGRGIDTFRLARMVARLLRESRGLLTAVPTFHARVDRALLPLAGEDLTSWNADQLLGLYRSLEDDLLRNWQTPLINDFFAMIWFGVLGRLVESWLPDAPASLANELLVHEGGIVSAEPAERVRELAREALEKPAVRRHFAAEMDPVALERAIAADPDCAGFTASLDAYLARFGDRCMNELKLETVTFSDAPSALLEVIRGYMKTIERGRERDDGTAKGRGREAREATERQVRRSLGLLRWRIFGPVLAQARARVRDRENLRFERTRVFGAVRKIFLGLGHHLVRAGRLDDPRDVFFLRTEEVFGYVEGSLVGSDLRALVRVRRDEWREYERLPAPPDRFESIGPVAEGRWVSSPIAFDTAPQDGRLTGIGCCPGTVRAPVRLVRDPGKAGDLDGHILVAERTDPGWTLLFPASVGILVERGSLLSHSAIVAREMGIPCVVSIPGLMSTLQDGEMVEMDGVAGTVRRLDE